MRRFPGTLDLFNHLRVQVARAAQRPGIARLEQATLIEAFTPLRREPARFALGCYLLELLDRLAPEGGARADGRRLFAFALAALRTVATPRRIDSRLRTLLELRALDALGPAPGAAPLRALRGRTLAAARRRGGLRVADGGPVCAACGRDGESVVARASGTLRALEQGLRFDLERLDRLVLSRQTLEESRRILDRFQRYHTGRRAAQRALPRRAAGEGSASRQLRSAPARASAAEPGPRVTGYTARPRAGGWRGRSGAMAADEPRRARVASTRMDDLVSLCARRGFVFPSSEIYGGINGFWDYGPLGVELKNNLKALWWQRVVRERDDVEGLDSSIISHPRTWEASGHVEHFSDPMVDCRACKKRFRADQLDEAGPCPARQGSSEHDFTEPRRFNLMLTTRIGASEDAAGLAYLRAETCQSIFNDFKRVREVARQPIPVRDRPDRQGVPQRDQPAQLHVPLARVRAGGARVLLPPLGAREVVRALARRAPALPPRPRLRRRAACARARTRPKSWRTIARRRSTSSTASRSAGRRSRASTTAATGT